MFRIDLDTMRIVFTPEDRDLALVLVEMEGMDVVGWMREREPVVMPVTYGTVLTGEGRVKRGTYPEQVSPGIFSYRIAYRTKSYGYVRKTPTARTRKELADA